MLNYSSLRDFASPRQLEYIDAIDKHGTQNAAAKALGVNRRTLQRALEGLEKKAAQTDPKLHQKQAPTGYHLRGASTLLDAAGNVKQTWVKTQKDTLDPSEFLELFKDAVETAPPRRSTLVPPPSADLRTDIMAAYPMGDPHLGLLSWARETGSHFDLKIAETQLLEAVDKLVYLAPACETALIMNLGDFFHADNMDARTWRSGNKLDVDSRWAKVLRAGVRVMKRCIDRALEKHARVRVINEIGNHDDHSSIMLSICLAETYEGNPRVEIDTSPEHFHWHRFGAVLIGTHHGLVKPERLPGIMATDRAKDWGETKHRYFYTGHIHSENKKEFPGVLWESFRTLAARDAWNHNSGYRAGRTMVCDVHHNEHGRVLRHEIGVDQLA